jgi:NAD(P)-dependent dehydrogenase (short-subunit alcohol dehydrogenase family)
MEMTALAHKVILVTGGSSGIGEGCARHFAALGARVVIASNQEERGGAIAAELRAAGHQADFAYVDLGQEESVKGLFARVLELHGRLDAVHCNAGVWGKGKVTEFDEAAWEKVMGLNVKSVLWTAKHAIPIMEAQGQGVLLITTSVAAFIGFPAHALYCASKAALEAVVRCLAVDHAGKVRVVGICPGTIDTPMLAASCEGWDKPVSELYAEVARRIPVRRLGQPQDIAHAAAFLLGDGAAYINGTSLVLDGGTMALPPW